MLAYFDILGWSKLTLESEGDEAKRSLIAKAIDLFNSERGFYGMRGIAEGTRCQADIASDSFFFSAPLEGDYGDTPLTVVSSLIHSLMSKRLYVRGSIVVGSLFHNQGVIVGPAIVRAVELEKLAGYPRIIVDERVFDHFQNVEVVQSEDGLKAFDWLPCSCGGDDPTTVARNAAHLLQIVEQKIVEDERDEKLLMKHRWMKSYLERFTTLASEPSR